MKRCAICGKITEYFHPTPKNAVPHITCATCGSTICYRCYELLKDKTECPICAKRKNAKVRISLPSSLLVKVATTMDGKNLEDKLNRCIEIGYEKLVKA